MSYIAVCLPRLRVCLLINPTMTLIFNLTLGTTGGVEHYHEIIPCPRPLSYDDFQDIIYFIKEYLDSLHIPSIVWTSPPDSPTSPIELQYADQGESRRIDDGSPRSLRTPLADSTDHQ